MPSGNRIRGNNSFGVTTNAPLASGAVAFNSTQLPTLPVVAAAHAVVVLDPKRQNGEPEIVVVTAHTASATVATITRGQYGTVARVHPAGTSWAHVPVDEDYIEILTAATRPSNPYEGQFIFETDTNKLLTYSGAAWVEMAAAGAWTAYTPTWTGTLGNGALVGRYQRIGRIIHFYISLRWGTTTSHAAAPQEWGVPVASIANTFYAPAGIAILEDTGTSLYTRLAVFPASATVIRAYLDNAYASNTVPFTWTNLDGIVIRGTYEAAA